MYIDETLVDAANYVVTSGSTVITLDEDFAVILGTGEHTLRIIFNNGGEAKTTFTIENQITPEVEPREEETPENPIEEETPTTPALQNPQTGDNIAMSIVVGLILLVGLAVTTIYIKKGYK